MMPTQNSEFPATIRRIQVDDAALVRDLTLQMLTDSPEAFGETLAEAQARTAAEWAQYVEHLATSPQECGFVAEDALGACGCVFGDAANPQAPPGTAVAGKLWVAPRQRGAGLGRALMAAVTAWAQERDAEQLALGVTEMNTRVIQFYEHLGYADTGMRFPWPPDSGHHIIILARPLKT